jgi:hypothetical protein
MKATSRVSLAYLCMSFKKYPNALQKVLKDCTLEVCITYYDKYYKTTVVEVDNLDDVVQCILKYR